MLPRIEMTQLSDFLGHRPCYCEICNQRPASVFMIARNGPHACKAHICLGCFEVAESSGFAQIVESVSLQDYMETEEGRVPTSG